MKKVLFLLILEEAPPSSNFSLKNLPAASKIDVVARVIMSIFQYHIPFLDFILDVIFTLEKPSLLQIEGLKDLNIHTDEISIAADIRELIKESENSLNKSGQINLIGNWQSIIDFECYLKNIVTEYEGIYYLNELGKNYMNQFIQDISKNSFAFILGGREDISDENEKIISKFNIIKISLGTKAYLASSCITKVLFSLEKLMDKIE